MTPSSAVLGGVPREIKLAPSRVVCVTVRYVLITDPTSTAPYTKANMSGNIKVSSIRVCPFFEPTIFLIEIWVRIESPSQQVRTVRSSRLCLVEGKRLPKERIGKRMASWLAF